MQTKIDSFIESNVSTLIGFMISYFLLLIINPIYDLNLTVFATLEITLIFTVVSIARNYATRRLFNKLESAK